MLIVIWKQRKIKKIFKKKDNEEAEETITAGNCYRGDTSTTS